MSKESAGGGAFYFFGFLGSAIYFISTAGDFWAGLVGFLKALIWPAFITFEVFSYLGS